MSDFKCTDLEEYSLSHTDALGARPLTVAALVTHYKNWDLTFRCVDAAIAHSGAGFSEIIVIDDSPTVPPPRPLPTQVKWVRPDCNQGFAASVALGFTSTAADVVVLFDMDAYPLSDVASPIREAFVGDPKLGAMSLGMVDENNVPTGSHEPMPGVASILLGSRLDRRWHLWWHKQFPGPIGLFACGLAVRRSAYEAVGGFDPRFHFDGDLDLSYRLHLAGWKLANNPTVRVFHKGNGQVNSIENRVLLNHQMRWQLLTKHNKIHLPGLVKGALFCRHLLEWTLIWVAGSWLYRNPKIRRDKLSGRVRLLKSVWREYKEPLSA